MRAGVYLAVLEETVRHAPRVIVGAGQQQDVEIALLEMGALVVVHVEDQHRVAAATLLGKVELLLLLGLLFKVVEPLLIGGGAVDLQALEDILDHRLTVALVRLDAEHDSHLLARMAVATIDAQGHRRRHLHRLGFEGESQRLLADHPFALCQGEDAIVHVGAGDAHRAVGAGFGQVAVEEVVELVVDPLAGEDEGVEAGAGIVVGEGVAVEAPLPLAAEAEPVEHALARLDAVEPGLDPPDALFAEDRQG